MGLTALQLDILENSAGKGIGVRDNFGLETIAYVGTVNRVEKYDGIYTVHVRVDREPYMQTFAFNPFFAESTYDGRTVKYMEVVLPSGGEFIIVGV